MTGLPRVAVIQFPGVNCEAETVRALERVGLGAEVFRWTRPAGQLRDFQAYVLPGGFSYQDRVRAGALAAKDPLVVFPKSLIKDYEFLRTTPSGLNKRTAIWAEFKGG